MLAGIDVGFTQHLRAVVHKGLELHISGGSGKNVTARGQNLRRLLDGNGEVAGHGRERGQKQVAEVMSFKVAGAGEAILKKLGEKVFVFRERNEAIANVARRQHSQLTAQTPARSAVITYGDERGEIRDEGPIRRNFTRTHRVLLKPLEQRGKAGASADGNNTNPPS